MLAGGQQVANMCGARRTLMAPQTDSASLIRPALSGLRQPLSLDSQHNGLCRNIFHTFPAATAKAGRQAAAGRRGPRQWSHCGTTLLIIHFNVATL